MSGDGIPTGSAVSRKALLTDRIEWLRRMLEIRALDEAALELFEQGHIRGALHTSIGQEGIGVGISAALSPDILVSATYRCHAVALGMGLSPRGILAEMLGRATGTIGGMGGSMHMVDLSVGLLPTNGIVGASYPIGVGGAVAADTLSDGPSGAVAICGDGATNIGAFHESLNLASVWKLPILFIIENNRYGEHTPLARTTPIEDLAERALPYGIPSNVVDGQDVDAVYRATRHALERMVQDSAGPQLLEMKTYRYRGHGAADHSYRPENEVAAWKARDPIDLFQSKLLNEGALTVVGAERIRQEVVEEVEDMARSVLDDPFPRREDMLTHVYADGVSS